jgi:hypothetical protein
MRKCASPDKLPPLVELLSVLADYEALVARGDADRTQLAAALARLLAIEQRRVSCLERLYSREDS